MSVRSPRVSPPSSTAVSPAEIARSHKRASPAAAGAGGDDGSSPTHRRARRTPKEPAPASESSDGEWGEADDADDDGDEDDDEEVVVHARRKVKVSPEAVRARMARATAVYEREMEICRRLLGASSSSSSSSAASSSASPMPAEAHVIEGRVSKKRRAPKAEMTGENANLLSSRPFAAVRWMLDKARPTSEGVEAVLRKVAATLAVVPKMVRDADSGVAPHYLNIFEIQRWTAVEMRVNATFASDPHLALRLTCARLLGKVHELVRAEGMQIVHQRCLDKRQGDDPRTVADRTHYETLHGAGVLVVATMRAAVQRLTTEVRTLTPKAAAAPAPPDLVRHPSFSSFLAPDVGAASAAPPPALPDLGALPRHASFGDLVASQPLSDLGLSNGMSSAYLGFM